MKFLLARLWRDGRTSIAYPARPLPPIAGSRGRPSLDIAHCQGCGQCAAACPTPALTVSAAPAANPSETGVLTETAAPTATVTLAAAAMPADGQVWRLDLSTCVFCALCAEACPTGALAMTPEHEPAATDRAALVAEFAIPNGGDGCGR